MGYPEIRLRRLRATSSLRELLTETSVRACDLVQPLFVIPGRGRTEHVEGLPGMIRLSADEAPARAERLLERGVKAVLLFGVPGSKSVRGENAFSRDNPVFSAVKEIKSRFPEMLVITDVCLCSHMESGHCGLVKGGKVLNDPTLELLAKYSLTAAECGCDAVAPSAMMDGMVGRIRTALEENGFQDILIISYSAKFASSLYGPFRVAADSAPHRGDRRSYQINPANLREALREMMYDEAEGADILMVKPSLPYLDVLAAVRELTMLPLAAYCVSGEYAMIKAAAREGWLDEREVVREILTSIKRAGASLIITYHAEEASPWVEQA